MAIYLKKFETGAQYNAYTADTENFILPNVSLITENNKVFYNPITPPTPSHDFVEIGGVKWATMNVGANSVTDTGLYFQWGDTQGYTASQVGSGEGKKYFGWADYKYTNDGGHTMAKYNSEDGKSVLEASDDAVTAAWGGSWRMPTESEYLALGEAVSSEWTSSYQGSGVAGLVCTDKTDSSKVLFFPAAGYCGDGSVGSVGSKGYYYASSISSSCGEMVGADSSFNETDGVDWSSADYSRYAGMVIRGILDE